MAESLRELKELFDLKDADLRTYSPLTLAYIGDGVYELVIRTILVKRANCPVNRLHKKASSLVKASAQSGMMEIIEPLLTEDEKRLLLSLFGLLCEKDRKITTNIINKFSMPIAK